MASTQDHFQVLGKNLVTIANLLLNNQNICKLLYYTTQTPLSGAIIANTDILMNKNIRVVPKVPDVSESGSFIVVLIDSDVANPQNNQTTLVTIRFDIICPIDGWLINESSLRPFLIMSEIGSMFNGLKIQGIGKLAYEGSERITISENFAGYSMTFTNHEFN